MSGCETKFEVEDIFGHRALVVPPNEDLWVGNPIPIMLDHEASTRTRLKDGGNPVWFIRLRKQFAERSSPPNGVSFREFVLRRHRKSIDITENVQEVIMAIKDADSARILASCARHCCICRRFKPLHLQVRHIKELSDGGSDEIENLIAVCLTCHSDVHTQTKLSRRFSEKELKLHRDAVIDLVAEGRLPAAELSNSVQIAFDEASKKAQELGDATILMPEAIEMLLQAVSAPVSEDGEGPIIALHKDTPFFIRVHTTNFGIGDPRKAAKYKKAFEQLIKRELLEPHGGVVFKLTDEGWTLGDQLLASGNE